MPEPSASDQLPPALAIVRQRVLVEQLPIFVQLMVRARDGVNSGAVLGHALVDVS